MVDISKSFQPIIFWPRYVSKTSHLLTFSTLREQIGVKWNNTLLLPYRTVGKVRKSGGKHFDPWHFERWCSVSIPVIISGGKGRLPPCAGGQSTPTCPPIPTALTATVLMMMPTAHRPRPGHTALLHKRISLGYDIQYPLKPLDLNVKSTNQSSK